MSDYKDSPEFKSGFDEGYEDGYAACEKTFAENKEYDKKDNRIAAILASALANSGQDRPTQAIIRDAEEYMAWLNQ